MATATAPTALDRIEETYDAYPPTEAMSFPWLTNA
jgi:hypothetical protein